MARALEEVGLYFESAGRLIELSLYRRRVQRADDWNTAAALEALRLPLAPLFNKQCSPASPSRRALRR